MDNTKYTCHIDIEGHQTPNGGTLPPEFIVTNLKPDVVIIDKKTRKIDIFELTVPGEARLEISNKLKTEKYQHFVSDISSYTVSVTAFEVGSNTGFINRQNNETFSKLHQFCKKDIKLKNFKKNISSIVVLSSYYLFNCRNNDSWETTNPILAPWQNN